MNYSSPQASLVWQKQIGHTKK